MKSALFYGSALVVALLLYGAAQSFGYNRPHSGIARTTHERTAFSRRHAPASDYMSYRSFGR